MRQKGNRTYVAWRSMLALAALLSSTACSEDRAGKTENMEAVDAAPEPEPQEAGVDGAETAAGGDYMGATGIGVSNFETSVQFYSEVLGMSLRYELAVPGYVNEKILYFKDSKGSDVVVMSYIDGRERTFKNNPVKLVFYVPSAGAVIEAIGARGLQILAAPAPQAAFGNTIVGFARDPDGYVLEIIEASDLAVPYLGAVGLGVADLDRAKDFYTRVLGMRAKGDLIKVPGVWDEWLMQHQSGKGSALVLLHYTDGTTRNYLNNPVKTVHFVADVRAVVAAIEAEGLPILSPPMMFDVKGTPALIALARDPDGYILELVQR
jgi:catechol 2,3-dioxygenase-like lactoylglutathione lyase family enzyme